MKAFIVKDQSGKTLRHGICDDALVDAQASEPGEVATEAAPEEIAAAKASYLEHRAARIPVDRADQPDLLEVMVEVLKGKGLAVTEADIAGAVTNLRKVRTLKEPK